MTLANDIETLREIQRDLDGDPELGHNQVGRVIAILEPLAGLSNEQIVYLIAHGVRRLGTRMDAPDIELSDAGLAYSALAASLTALRGQR